MRRHVPSMTLLLWVIALALLVVRTADAHIHLCFDGQESRSSFHILDRAFACHESDGTHHDQDVDALGAAQAKKSPQVEPLVPLSFPGVVLLLVPPQAGMDYELTLRNPSPKLPDLFLPLLRGPPV